MWDHIPETELQKLEMAHDEWATQYTRFLEIPTMGQAYNLYFDKKLTYSKIMDVVITFTPSAFKHGIDEADPSPARAGI